MPATLYTTLEKIDSETDTTIMIHSSNRELAISQYTTNSDTLAEVEGLRDQFLRYTQQLFPDMLINLYEHVNTNGDIYMTFSLKDLPPIEEEPDEEVKPDQTPEGPDEEIEPTDPEIPENTDETDKEPETQED